MPMFKRLLVPVDGSHVSKAAVKLALGLARDQRASVIFIYVYEIARIVAMVSTPAVATDPSSALATEREWGMAALDAAMRAAKEKSVRAKRMFVEGASVDSILRAATEERADLIVMGSHGRTGIARAVVGSVAEGVLRHADVPVLVSRIARASAGARSSSRTTTDTSNRGRRRAP